MSQLREQLRKIMPRLSEEANKLRDLEARRRWMLLKKITESTKSLSQACAFYGVSEDFYFKWGLRLKKQPRVKILFSRSRKPYRSPLKTKSKKEKKIAQIRRSDPSLGPERIADDLQRYFKMKVPVSTVYAVLKRLALISKKKSERLTKKHLKRYRRPFPGYLQMDFKYVPYPVEGRQLYQLSCVDHHSSWRFIRIYPEKSLEYVMQFLKELRKECPFPIEEIQTDNDTAFTDKFSSRQGVTGLHAVDMWCESENIKHRLIPPGVKELNGKVENTHKQDDREFFAKGPYKNLEQIKKYSLAYNERWNEFRRTKRLGFKSPNEVIVEAYARAMAYLQMFRTEKNKGFHQLDIEGNMVLRIQEPKPRKEIKARKRTYVEKYLKYIEWEDQKKKLYMFMTAPSMSQVSSWGFFFWGLVGGIDHGFSLGILLCVRNPFCSNL